ncbi:hypothetical protein FACS1894181_02650 [Bacteroidia bacterium]|nr:hypothetical protein FACS1894181_02650 [Bacteroidia bacterium]
MRLAKKEIREKINPTTKNKPIIHIKFLNRITSYNDLINRIGKNINIRVCVKQAKRTKYQFILLSITFPAITYDIIPIANCCRKRLFVIPKFSVIKVNITTAAIKIRTSWKFAFQNL